MFKPALLLGSCLFFAAPAVYAQGFGDLFRSMGNALRPAPQPEQQRQGSTAATLGVRGHDETTQAAGPASKDVGLLDGWAATPSQATEAAAQRGLRARPASFGTSASPAPAKPVEQEQPGGQ